MELFSETSGIISDLPAPKIARIHPSVLPYVQQLGAYSFEMGYTLKIVSGFRTLAEQTLRWKSYIEGISPYKAKPPRFSSHEGPTVDFRYSLAVDMMILDLEGEEVDVNNQLYKQYGRVWNGYPSIDIEGTEYVPVWNGGYNPIHFEYRKLPVQSIMVFGPKLIMDEEEING